MSGKQFGNVSEYDVSVQDIEQAIRAIEKAFDGRVEVRLQADMTTIAGARLWMSVDFYHSKHVGNSDADEACIWVLPNERTKTINGSMLWFLCELYDKLEARAQGVTDTHPRALPRWLAAHWTGRK